MHYGVITTSQFIVIPRALYSFRYLKIVVKVIKLARHINKTWGGEPPQFIMTNITRQFEPT